jgi:Predicted membrane protein (DUF2207)
LSRPPRRTRADAQIDSFTINYEMQPSGVLKVMETIVWRIGSNSGRHGMERHLVIREPDPNSDQDFVYGISNIKITSPDPGVATQFSTTTTESQGGRVRELNVRIGDPNQTISAPTATYVISYDVTGAMRSFGGYDEFYWDVTGFWQPVDQGIDNHGHSAWWGSGCNLFRGAGEKPHALPDYELHQGRPGQLQPDQCPAGGKMSVSVSRSCRVWWRTTSLTWNRTAPNSHQPKGWVRSRWLR